MSLLSRLAVQAARAYGMLVAGSANNVSADYLVVAGGGSGGSTAGTVGDGSGGGGAGGFRTSTATLSTLNTYTITVGAGGVGPTTNSTGANGSNSVISGTGLTTVTSTGGGGGGGGGANGNGASGGSGGGSSSVGGVVGTAGTGTAGQGNNGGTGSNSAPNYPGGGGGGASATGGNATSTAAGTGGNGTASSISGSSVTYAGGGGGGAYLSGAASGGSGGGGAGGNTAVGTAGTANTGGGGGGGGTGASSTVYAGGNGGSGIVIISYTSATPKFVGGTITTSGGKQIHTFTSSGTLSPITPITASYLVVAGGAGGGGNYHTVATGGGGGAGGLLTSSTTLYSGATYVVTVGAGGAGGTGGAGTNGTNGTNSTVSGTGLTTLTAVGGGYGATNQKAGGSGGSGGGASGPTTPGSFAGGTGTAGQGNDGGSANQFQGAGGGGAGAVGASGATGLGGAGLASSISGTSTYYAGGGGTTTASLGGGGIDGGSGTTNTGGGGGRGASGANNPGGAGGSGIVIISYAGSQQFNGGLVTSSGGNTIHTFTATGALTPLTNNLTNSLRFRSSASAYLNRTPTVTSNLTTWTWSGWVKLGALSTDRTLFGAASSGNAQLANIHIAAANSFEIDILDANSTRTIRGTTAVYRDPSAWYHVVFILDTTQATAANRMRLYINGNQISLDVAIVGTYPAQNANCIVNSTSGVHNVGRRPQSNDRYFDGYMTDINFIDGQALEPYYFGNNDANGVWKPIQYKGTYGTNGFYLTFGNTTSTTTLGYDSSPNGNNWTTNNISLTAGTTYDAMTDVPTNTSATVANYCTLNPIATNTVGVGTLSNANLNFSIPNTFTVYGTMSASSGKYYWEAVATSSPIGVGIKQLNVLDRYSNTIYYMGSSLSGTGEKYVNGTGSAYGASWTTGDVIGVAVDMDGGTVTFYKNNASQGSINLSLATITEFVPTFVSGAGATFVGYVNFGQRPFAYTPPTGFVALNTFNLPTPTILQGNKYMDATAYSGTNVTNVIVNQGQFRPDFVWCKGRSAAGSWHALFDTVRGATKGISTNSTDAEYTSTAGNDLASFNSNGFTVGTTQNWGSTNQAGQTMVGWQWQAGQGTTSSNTSGSITSTVSVNTTAGFSIVTYTGSGAAGTVGHGLGVAPAMIITKNRTTGGNSWVTWHKSLTNAYSSTTGFIYLDQTAAGGTTTNFYDGTAMTSSTFRWQTGNININSTSNNYVSYVWAEIAGFSRFGSYTGNGSANGTFVYTGFQPEFIMWKRTDAIENWGIWTPLANGNGIASNNNFSLFPNLTAAQDTTQIFDTLSNGFKNRDSGSLANANGGTYIYMAFAINPFKISNAR